MMNMQPQTDAAAPQYPEVAIELVICDTKGTPKKRRLLDILRMLRDI